MIRAALRRPIEMVLPPKKLPIVIPMTPAVEMSELLNFVSSSDHPSFAAKIGGVKELQVNTIGI